MIAIKPYKYLFFLTGCTVSSIRGVLSIEMRSISETSAIVAIDVVSVMINDITTITNLTYFNFLIDSITNKVNFLTLIIECFDRLDNNNFLISMSSDFETVTYYTLDEIINFKTSSKTVFIIANEKRRTNGNIGRFFTAFPSFKQFLNQRSIYKHCHEIFINHVNNSPNIKGRLVFDFDIKDCEVPSDFKDQIEDTVYEVVQRYFQGIDAEKFDYVWSHLLIQTNFLNI